MHERTFGYASQKQSHSLSLHESVLYPRGETPKIPIFPAHVRSLHGTSTVVTCNVRFTSVTGVKE